MNYNVIVVGAGFAGSVFAREMANCGKHVLILEKRSHIGGNMYEKYCENGVRVHCYGPHIFHTNSAKVFQYLRKYSDFYPYEHKVLGSIDGELIPIPFNFKSIDIIFEKEKAKKLKTKLKCTFTSERVPVFDLITCSDADIKDLGKLIFGKVYVNYTAKQWGLSADQIDQSVINRVPVVLGYDDRYFHDTYQAMPKEGFTVLFEHLLDHPYIEVALNQSAQNNLSLDFERGIILFQKRHFYGDVLFTGAIDEFFNYRYGALPYRSLDLVFENKNRTDFQTGAVVNYPNEEAFTRITEFKYLTGQKLNGCTEILKEYPMPFDIDMNMEPFYPIAGGISEALYHKYTALIKEFRNFYLCGRLAEYRYYNMDAVIDRALTLANQILKRSGKTEQAEQSKPAELVSIGGKNA